MTAAPVPHPPIPVLAERGDTQLQTPRAIILVDTREAESVQRLALPRSVRGDGEESVGVGRQRDCRTGRRMHGRAKGSLGLGSFTSPLSQVKSRYTHSNFDPNRVTQFLVAALAGLQVPFVCSETHELREELVSSSLYQLHLYHWLESNDYGRFPSDNDL
jgi:hypothetical protein